MKIIFRLLFICQALVMMIHSGAAQNPGEWMWIHGSNTFGSAGHHGTLGIPDSMNEPPAFYGSAVWTDLNGNLWLFSGWNQANTYNNDMFKYDPAIDQWTWINGNGLTDDPGDYGIQGIPSPNNLPPSRTFGCITWTDLNNNLWMFGGNHAGTNAFNDLWKYDIATNEWTWMSGPSSTNLQGVFGTKGVPDPANYPGARFETTAGWTEDNGNLWLFGGARLNSCLNDLWKYDISTNQWTWMNGDSVANAVPVYGTRTVEDPANNPGARIVYSSWKDNANNLWLFGSGNYYQNQVRNDMWRYNISTNSWTWMHGSDATLQQGTYGSQCITDPLNTPGYRYENRAHWTDRNGNFWLMGGGYGSTYTVWNDLWMYCVSTNQWVWVDESLSPNPTGNWGTKNVSFPANHPNGRCAAVTWADADNHLYLFGGTDNTFLNFYNDLWKYTIDTTCSWVRCETLTDNLTSFFAGDEVACPGSCIDFVNTSFGYTSFQWIFSGGNPGISTDVNPTGICYNNPGMYDVTLIASGPSGTDTLIIPNYITVLPFPPAQGINQSGDTLFANAGAVSYQWFYDGNLITGATDFFYVAPQSGNFHVVCTDSNDCQVEAAIFDVIASLHYYSGEESGLVIYPNPAKDQSTVSFSSSGIGRSISIKVYNVVGQLMYAEEVHPADEITQVTLDLKDYTKGIYFLVVKSPERIYNARFARQ